MSNDMHSIGTKALRARAIVAAVAVAAGTVLGGAGPARAAVLCFGQPATMVGDAGDNTITGTAGKDVIHGGAGIDTINGMEGDDVVCGGPGNDVIYGRTGNDILLGGDGPTGNNDGIDRLYGGPGHDTLYGGDSGDLLHGEGDNDVLYGNAGDDILDGGIGTDDTVDYQYAPQGVAVDLAAGTATGDGADKLAGVERAVGSPFADRLLGDALANTFNGLEGDDSIDGRGGVDTVKYTNHIQQPINANLTTGTAFGVGHGSDRLANIENLGGTLLDDILVGDAGPNLLAGRVGNDILAGLGGDDTLQGGGDVLYPGPDNDVLLGGDGNDVLTGNDGNDVLDGGPGTNPGDGGLGADICFNVNPAVSCP